MDQTRWLDEREQAAWRGLLSMQAKLGARLRRAHQRDSGLSDSDYAVLVHVSEAPEGRLRIFELGAQLEWEKSRLSHHLRRMEQRDGSEEHTSELQSLMRISYAVFCLKKKQINTTQTNQTLPYL